MPSSRCHHIPVVVNVVQQLQPKSILDIGVGFGKWGHLFREYTDIVSAEADHARYQRENWKVRIDGIEGYEPYLTDAHRFFYNNIYVGDMRQKIKEVGEYDLIFLGDVIEHIDKADGEQLLRECLQRARLAVMATTPSTDKEQGAACGNELEIHRSHWKSADFRRLGRCVTTVVRPRILVAVLPASGVVAPALAAVVPKWRKQLRNWLGKRKEFSGSQNYWEQRYARGKTSGKGSEGQLARYKADVINQFVAGNNVKSVVDFGAGDGQQLALLHLPDYVGLDVSATAIENLRKQFADDSNKRFEVITSGQQPPRAELALSLDVIYHLVEDEVYESYLRSVFESASRYVIIYSSNKAGGATMAHVRHREFTKTVAEKFPGWTLIKHLENPLREESFADFYIYERRG